MSLKEKREKKAKLVYDARSIQERVEKEKRSFTAEERKQVDDILKEVDTIKAEIAEAEADEERSRRLKEHAADLERGTGRRSEPDPPGDPEERGGRRGENRRDESEEVRRWRLRSGCEREIELRGTRATPEYRATYARYLAGGARALSQADIDRLETRAHQSDDDAGGGYLVAPIQMVAGLLQAVDDLVHIRQHATIETVTQAQSLGVTSLDSDPDDAEWTRELKSSTEDTSTRFGRRELHPELLVKRLKISRRLLRLSGGRIESIIRSRLAYKVAITQEKAFLTGTGNKQPLGVFTASANGIPTSRDVSTGNTTSAIAADNLIHVKYSLKGQYHSRARWLFHRDAIKQLVLLKDANNRYLWMDSIRDGEPDRLLNMPVMMSEYAPNTFAAGLYVGLLGDFSFYQIADSLNLEIQVLDQLYAETNQMGYIARMETDGMPVLAEAFARVKLASS